MQRKLRIFVLGLCFLPAIISAQDNLAPNGNFENGINEHWELISGGTSSVSYTLDNTSAIEGVNCLQAAVTALGPNSWDVQIKNGFGPVVEGHIYRASIWARSATAGSSINFTIGKATAGYTEYASAYGLGLSTDWKEYTLEFTAAVSTTDDITLALHISGTDTYWFDDFKVVEVLDDINSAIVATTGQKVILDFNFNLSTPGEDDQLPFFVFSDDTYYSVEEVTPHTSSDMLNLILSDVVPQGAEISVTYIPGTLRNTAGIEIETFTIQAENRSTQVELGNTDFVGEGINGIKVFPTIPQQEITVEIPENVILRNIRLADMSGRTINALTGPISSSVKMDVSALQQGMYLIIFETDKSEIGFKKIIKN